MRASFLLALTLGLASTGCTPDADIAKSPGAAPDSGSSSGSGSGLSSGSGGDQCPVGTEPVGACSTNGQTCGPYYGCANCICEHGLWNCADGACPDASVDSGGAGVDAAYDSGGDAPTIAPDAGVIADAGMDAPPATTGSILRSHSKACYDRIEVADASDENGHTLVVETGCAVRNGCFDPIQQGITCELLQDAGALAHYGGMLDGGKTCTDVLGSANVSEMAVCLQTLDGILSSNCAATLNQTPCLCGSTSADACLQGTGTPAGPLYEEYACDFDSIRGDTINSQFTLQTFGAGAANGIVQCMASFAGSGDPECCLCFGGSVRDSGTCSLVP
jgi:hypothetical protein